MGRSRRVAVDSFTFEQTGIEWGPGFRSLFTDTNAPSDSVSPNFSDDASLDFTRVNLPFFTFGVSNVINVWGLGLVSFGEVSIAQRHFMMAASTDTDPSFFPGSYLSLTQGSFGQNQRTYRVDVGRRDFEPDISTSGTFEFGPPQITYSRSDAVDVAYIGFDQRLITDISTTLSNRILLTPTSYDNVGAVSEGRNAPPPFTADPVPARIGGTGNDILFANSTSSADYNGTAILKLAHLVNSVDNAIIDPANAIDLDRHFDFRADPGIESAEAIPHATVIAEGSGVREVYRFTVAPNGGRAIFDIDATTDLDSFIRLLDADGAQLAFDDDDATGSPTDPGSASTFDSRLTHNFASGGTYYIEVGRYASATTSAAVLLGSLYTLHVSLERARIPLTVDLEGGAVDGGDGSDVIISSRGDDLLDGSFGDDTASFDQSSVGVVASIPRGLAVGDGEDRLIGIENLTGSNFNDTLIGGDFRNALNGLDGDDRLSGGDDDDTLSGGMGADFLDGGAGIDTAVFLDFGPLFINLSTGQGFGNEAQGDRLLNIENLTGSPMMDYFIGDSGVNVLNGAGGNDILIGSLGGDVLIGGSGGDTASYEENWGAVFINLTIGQGFGNAAQGDTYQSIENLTGSVFYDTFIGNEAANILDGARGADTLTGAAGADTFVMSTPLDGFINVDSITDFTPVDDTIRLSANIFAAAGGAGTLAAPAFTTGSAATSTAHRIIYNPANGQLLYDADGSGAGASVLFATIGQNLGVTAADFVIG